MQATEENKKSNIDLHPFPLRVTMPEDIRDDASTIEASFLHHQEDQSSSRKEKEGLNSDETPTTSGNSATLRISAEKSYNHQLFRKLTTSRRDDNVSLEMVDPLSESQLYQEKMGSAMDLVESIKKEKEKETEMETKAMSKYSNYIAKPIFIYFVTLVQTIILIYSYMLNYSITGKYLEPLQENPMIGPSSYALILLGARYVPCMKDTGISTASIYYCPIDVINNNLGSPNRCSLSDICGFGGFTGTPNQWYRAFSAILVHSGLVHFFLNGCFQIFTAASLERYIGIVRFSLVYISSGVAGFILGATLSGSTYPAMGSSGSCFGVIGCILVDLILNWKFATKPKAQLLKLVISIIITGLLGLFPHIDNFSHLGGFLTGILAGLAFLPSIHSGTRERKFKKSLRFIFGPLIVILIVALFILFPQRNWGALCQWCHYFDCIPLFWSCQTNLMQN